MITINGHTIEVKKSFPKRHGISRRMQFHHNPLYFSHIPYNLVVEIGNFEHSIYQLVKIEWSFYLLAINHTSFIWLQASFYQSFRAISYDHHKHMRNPWWRHQIGNNFRVTGHLCGEFTGPGELPTQRPVRQSFAVFFDLRLNERLRFETPSWS